APTSRPAASSNEPTKPSRSGWPSNLGPEPWPNSNANSTPSAPTTTTTDHTEPCAAPPPPHPHRDHLRHPSRHPQRHHTGPSPSARPQPPLSPTTVTEVLTHRCHRRPATRHVEFRAVP